MFYKFRMIKLSSYFEICFKSSFTLCLGLCATILFGLAGGCSTEHYKAEADEEVYKIIDSKWQDEFGIKANYTISDYNDPESPNAVELSELIPESGVINLQQAVEIATKFSREYQSQKESLYLSALDLTLTRHQYARQWFATIDGSYIDDKSETPQGDYDDTSIEGTVGVNQQLLLLDGVLLNVGIVLDWTRFLTDDPRASIHSVLSGDITVPLLGAGAGKSARENLTQAERSVLYQIRTFNRYRKSFVVGVISDYYRVLQQNKSVEIAKASYERQVESTKQLQMEVEVGKRAPSEADEAQQRLLNAQNNLISAQQRYEQALDRFKIRLSLPTDANITLDQNELTALEEIGIGQPEYTEEEAIEIALARRLDLANTKDELEDAARRLELAAEGLGVQLNLIGSADVSSPEGETNFDRLQFNRGIYELGFESDLPLDRKAERNAYREALISLQQQKRSYDEDVENIKLDVRQAYRDLTETAESYRIQKVGMELAERRVVEQQILLEYGRGTMRLLIETEDDLVNAQNNVIGALVNHTIAKMSFFRDVGILQVKPDGMWERRIQ